MQTFDEDTLRSAFALEEGITPEVWLLIVYPCGGRKNTVKLTACSH